MICTITIIITVNITVTLATVRVRIRAMVIIINFHKINTVTNTITTTFINIIQIKVERDIKTTFKAGDFVSRKVSKETNNLFTGVAEISKPLLSLPATIKRLGLELKLGSGLESGSKSD
jgi:hypothetical protein